MPGAPQSSVAHDIASALSWWREAGVDCDFSDEAVAWLAEDTAAAPSGDAPRKPMVPVAAAKPPEPVKIIIGGERENWPQDLVSFQAWWMTEPSLDRGSVAGRVPPRGATGAKLMVLVEQPEVEDNAELLSGPHGKLVLSMLRAMDIAPAEAYFASVLPRNTPLPDWQALAASGLADVLRLHLRIAAPQRIVALGSNIPPLLGHDPAQSAQNLHSFNHEGLTIPMLLDRGPDALQRARAKAGFWQRWLDWSGT